MTKERLEEFFPIVVRTAIFFTVLIALLHFFAFGWWGEPRFHIKMFLITIGYCSSSVLFGLWVDNCGEKKEGESQ